MNDRKYMEAPLHATIWSPEKHSIRISSWSVLAVRENLFFFISVANANGWISLTWVLKEYFILEMGFFSLSRALFS